MKGIFWGDCTRIFKNNGKDNRIEKYTIEEYPRTNIEVKMLFTALPPGFGSHKL